MVVDVFATLAARGHAGGMFAWDVRASANADAMDQISAQQHRFRQVAARGGRYAELTPARYLTRGLTGPTDLAEAQQWLKAAQPAEGSQARFELEPLPAAEAASFPSAIAA